MKLSVGNKLNKDDAFLQQVAKQDSSVSVRKKAASKGLGNVADKKEEKQVILLRSFR